MKYSYDLSINDMMSYYEQLVFSENVPSIVNAIKRWERLVFITLVCLYPMMVYSIFSSGFIYIVTVIVLGISYIFFKKKSTLLYWFVCKKKYKKDLLATYFKNNDKTILPYTIYVYYEKLEMSSPFSKKEFFKDDIVLKRMTDKYVFFHTDKFDGGYILLNNVSDSSKKVLEWFS